VRCNLALFSGHTFCTKVTFERVAEAIAESAFVTSQLPVILSLEMHLCPKQQCQLATKAVAHFESALLTVG
jgi:hypothetical protein